MFRELMNFSYQRSALQALGWYLTFILLGALLSALAGIIFAGGYPTFSEAFQRAVPIGQWVGIAYQIVLAGALLWSRWKAVLNIFLALGGVLLVPAFLGT